MVQHARSLFSYHDVAWREWDKTRSVTKLTAVLLHLARVERNRVQSESRNVINLPNKAWITLYAFLAVARSNKTAVIICSSHEQFEVL